MTRPDPHTLYTEALTRHQAVAAEADRLGRRLADLRTVAFFSALGLLGAALWGGLTPHAIWLPFAAFVWLVILHGRATAREVGARRAAAFHEAGLRRLNGTWAGTGRTGAGLAAADHPYAADLDILGRGSLFELICTARTRAGEQRLAEFLLSPAAPALVRARQAAVAELAPRLGLREALAVEEGDAGDALTRGTCAAWGAGPRRLAGTVEPYVHALAAAASTVLLVAWLFFDGRGAPMLAAMLLQFVLAARRRQAVTDVLEAADRPAQDLALLGHLLEHLERAEFESPHLRARVQALATDGRPPSRRIATLARLMDFVDARRNQLVLPIAWLLSSGTLLAYRIEAWRAENGPVLADWLDALAEVEALACLAAHTCDHPEDPFPTLLEDEGPRLEARAIAHPLLPRDQAVPNDVTLAIGAEDTPQALLVSGSNMSGKSTLLRTVGVNTVLALAGAPVYARAFTLTPLAVAASIRIHDSLQDGASRFYAEIARLKQVVDIAQGALPALFLLDEILHGTNSHDRRVGAAAAVRALIEHGAIGFVTTHDLALADMERRLAGRVRNVHFEDQVVDGQMAFDYTLRPGVVTRSNALALMRLVGLDVTDEDAAS